MIPIRYIQKTFETFKLNNRVFYISAMYLDGIYIHPELKVIISGGGISEDPDISLLKAEMEFIERYHWYTFYKKYPKRYKYGRDFDTKLRLDIYPFFNQEELYVSFPMYTLDQKEIDVPAELLFYTYPWKKPIYSQTTNGFGANYDLISAIFSGIKELIERDAIMSWWYGGKDVKETLVIDTNIGKIYFAKIDSYHNSFITYVSVLKLENYPGIVMGGSANIYEDNAILHALEEIIQLYLSVDKFKHKLNSINSVDDVKTIDDIFIFWIKNDGNYVLNRIRADKAEKIDLDYIYPHDISYHDKVKTLRNLSDEILLLYKDITYKEFDNMHVVVTYSPDLLPFQMPKYPLKNHPRLSEVKETLVCPLA